MKRPSKQDQLLADFKAYNARYKSDKRMQMTLSEFTAWVNGTTKLSKSTKSTSKPLGIPSWAVSTAHIPSVMSKTKSELPKQSMVEKVKTGLITGDDATNIINKSKRIGIAYSKGSYQYITDETDIKTIGKKSQQL